jgi:hypothetical protein
MIAEVLSPLIPSEREKLEEKVSTQIPQAFQSIFILMTRENSAFQGRDESRQVSEWELAGVQYIAE